MIADTGTEPASPFGLDQARTEAVQMMAIRRYQAMRTQITAYFYLLVRLAQRTGSESLPGLLDRIERTLAEMDRRRITRYPETPAGEEAAWTLN